MSRYIRRIIATNKNEQYKDLFDKRGVLEIEQYRTPSFAEIEQDVLDSIEVSRYIWKHGDLYWKISSRYYGSPKYWWVIAAFNRKPTESHIELGEVIKIPVNLAEALQVVR